jgi:hypothetical protein
MLRLVPFNAREDVGSHSRQRVAIIRHVPGHLLGWEHLTLPMYQLTQHSIGQQDAVVDLGLEFAA